ncbi:unnamed protein product [Victoria cruziana]
MKIRKSKMNFLCGGNPATTCVECEIVRAAGS